MYNGVICGRHALLNLCSGYTPSQNASSTCYSDAIFGVIFRFKTFSGRARGFRRRAIDSDSSVVMLVISNLSS